MSDQVQTNQAQDNKPSDKELNFRMLEAKYEKQLAQERSARMEAEKLVQEASTRNNRTVDEEDDSEPYVDHKKLNKTLNRFSEQTKQQTQSDIQHAIKQAREEAKQESWLENNPDFYEVLQNAEKFAQKSPALAKTILSMPEGFERQKLVYHNIKELGLDRAEVKAPTIQDKIDSNRRSPFYQPTGVGSAPYAGQAADFSPKGQKEAHAKMQELKDRLRI